MHTDDELKDELKDVSPGFPGKRTIPAPEGYFDLLPDRVWNRWEEEKGNSASSTISLRNIISTAAVVSGLCFAVIWSTNHSNHQQEVAAISSDEAYQYILEHIDEFAPMILEHGQLAEEHTVDIPPSAITEEFLLEEMEDEDFESIF